MTSSRLKITLHRPRFPDPQLSINIDKQFDTSGCRKKPAWVKGELCWEACGPALDAYNTLLPAVWRTLKNKCTDDPDEVRLIVKVYMIGLDLSTAAPVLVFVCKNEYAAKEAKNVVKADGILKEYPGFKTALMDILPSGDLVEVADSPKSRFQDDSQNDRRPKVYFDMNGPVDTIAMPIFIKHPIAPLRKATANLGFDSSKLLYLFTAAHAFQAAEPPTDTMVGWGSESDMTDDSDSETEQEREQLSQHSVSSHEESPSDPSSDGYACESPEPIDVRRPLIDDSTIPPLITANDSNVTFRDTTAPEVYIDQQDLPNNAEKLECIGYLHKSSSNRDWALVRIDNDRMIQKFLGEVNVEDYRIKAVASKPRCAAITVLTSWGRISGSLSEVPLLMRLPRSSQFVEVYQFQHNENLRMGDCGSLVVDQESKELYGHVIAGSSGSCTGFMVAASGTMEELDKNIMWNWNLSDLTFKEALEPLLVPPSKVHTTTQPPNQNAPDSLERLAKMLGDQSLSHSSQMKPVESASKDFLKHRDRLAALRALAQSSLRDFEAPVTELSSMEIEILEDIDERHRTEARFRNSSVWIEWKNPETLFPHEFDSVSEERIKRLAAMLEENNKVARIRTAHYLGYFRDEEETRFGLVFENPVTVPSSARPVSLRALLASPVPSLTVRISLMRLISEIMEPLHAVGWLHKGFCSANILFFQNSSTSRLEGIQKGLDHDSTRQNPENSYIGQDQYGWQLGTEDTTWEFTDPYITGFSDSRPEVLDDMTERPINDVELEIYRHPAVQSSGNRGVFKMSYDIYSLGIVLLEIALWKPIEAILKIDLMKARPKDTHAIRQRILEGEYLGWVKTHQGNTVESIVRYCIEGPENLELGQYVGQWEDVPITDQVQLQEEFHVKVVERLRGIQGL